MIADGTDEVGQWLLAAEGHEFSSRFEFANRHYWHMPLLVGWDAGRGCYAVSDSGESTRRQVLAPQTIYLARRQRVFRYRRGVGDRLVRLARKYFVDRIAFEAGDVVLDCGANVGEIGRYLAATAEGVRYVAVEPSAREAAACDANNFDGASKTLRFAMWKAEAELPLYDGNDTADSSLIAPATFSGSNTVAATTIARIADDHALERIKLLKIDGEGAEPEILEGAAGVLDRVTYCAIDCGPERGAGEQHVIPEVCNFMLARGFEVRDVNLDRQVFFFANNVGGG